MFAVVTILGHQYKVAKGDTLKVSKMADEEGTKVQFGDVMLWYKSETDIEVGTPHLEVVVHAKVVEHGKDDKIRVVKHKKRKRYTRVQGHRQQYSLISIEDIVKGKADMTKQAKPAVKAEKLEDKAEKEVKEVKKVEAKEAKPKAKTPKKAA